MNQEAWKSMGINQAESGKKHSAAAHGLNRQGTFFRLTPGAAGSIRYFVTAILALLLWFALYSVIEPTAQKITFDLLSLKKGSPAGDAVEFFLYDTAKILLLLVLMIYVISWLRAGLRVERVRDYLSRRGRVIGYFLGAGFGAITPFCSCSSIPLFLGFTMARIPVGITMAFLITSPLINEVAVVLLWGLLGWKFLTAYVAVGLFAGVAGGMFMDAIHAERWLQPFVTDALRDISPCGTAIQTESGSRIGLKERHSFATPKQEPFSDGSGNGLSSVSLWAPCFTALFPRNGSQSISEQASGGQCPAPSPSVSPSTRMSQALSLSWRVCCSRDSQWAQLWLSA